MKIAAATNDGQTISAHFGRARAFRVATVEEGQIVVWEQRDREQDAENDAAANLDHHDQALAALSDCDVVLSRGMGAGMHMRLQRARIRPILTDVVDIHEAVTAFLEGRLKNRPELVH